MVLLQFSFNLSMILKKKNNNVLVYILNHNYSEYLEQSIKSVLNQSYKKFKLLIIDDGSTDNSKQILNKYKNHRNVEIIYQKKIGMIKSIIKAINNNDSEYFVRLDADDWLHKDFLKQTLKAMRTDNKIALVFPDYIEVDKDGQSINRIRRNKFDKKNILFDFPAHGACTVFRRKLYNKTEGYSSKINAQDGYDIWLKIVKKFRVKNINKPLFYYRQHQNNLTKNKKRILENRYKILENHSEKKNNFKSLAFIPIIENEKKKLFSFELFKRKKLIDICIKKVLYSKKILKVVISTNSQKLIQYIKFKYKKNSKIGLHLRDINKYKTLSESIVNYLKNNKNVNIKNLAIMTIEYPLTSLKELEAGINSLNIFDAHAVDSVVNVNSIFYYKSKNTMKIWGNKLLKKERDDIYIRKGGITIIDKKQILKQKKIVGLDKVAHLLIHPICSLNYQELCDFKKFL